MSAERAGLLWAAQLADKREPAAAFHAFADTLRALAGDEEPAMSDPRARQIAELRALIAKWREGMGCEHRPAFNYCTACYLELAAALGAAAAALTAAEASPSHLERSVRRIVEDDTAWTKIVDGTRERLRRALNHKEPL